MPDLLVVYFINFFYKMVVSLFFISIKQEGNCLMRISKKRICLLLMGVFFTGSVFAMKKAKKNSLSREDVAMGELYRLERGDEVSLMARGRRSKNFTWLGGARESYDSFGEKNLRLSTLVENLNGLVNLRFGCGGYRMKFRRIFGAIMKAIKKTNDQVFLASCLRGVRAWLEAICDNRSSRFADLKSFEEMYRSARGFCFPEYYLMCILCQITERLFSVTARERLWYREEKENKGILLKAALAGSSQRVCDYQDSLNGWIDSQYRKS